jgi:hypothetical protein
VAKTTADRIVLQQVRELAWVEQIIHRNDLGIRARNRRAKRHPADASEPVDANSGHGR